MKMHCYQSDQVERLLESSPIMIVQGERIWVSFKQVNTADSVLPNLFTDTSIYLVTIENWTKKTQLRAQDIKAYLQSLCLTQYLIDNKTGNLISVTYAEGAEKILN